MSKNTKSNSHNLRRLKYSLNITIAIAVAITIITIINVIAYRQVKQFDYSATRSHLLSQQSQNAIKDLKNTYRITALINQPKPNSPAFHQTTQLTDLIKQYDHQSSKISAKHIYLSDTLEREAFLKTINQQFEKDPALKKLHRAITTTLTTIKAATPNTLKLNKIVDETLTNSKISLTLRNALNTANLTLKEIQTKQAKISAICDQQLTQSMPNLQQCKYQLIDILYGYPTKQQPFAIAYLPQLQRINRTITPHLRRRDTDTSLLEPLAQISNLTKALLSQFAPITQTLVITQTNESYDKFLADIQTGQTVIIQQNDKIQTIPLSKIFTQTSSQQAKATTTQQVNFLGEELITGNIIKMSLEHHPRIVFVSTTPINPINPSSKSKDIKNIHELTYTYITHRLQNLKFDTQAWLPLHTQNGQKRKFTPHTPPKPNQKTIWVLLPLEERKYKKNAKSPDIIKTIQHIQDKVSQGDSAMIMLTPRLGEKLSHPTSTWLKKYNILLDSDQMIFKENLKKPQNARAEAFILKNKWLKSNPITKAQHGSPGFFLGHFPIQLPQNSQTVKPLIQLNQGILWTENNPKANAIIKPNPNEIKPYFNIACTIQDKSQRIIVTSTKAWASDLIAGNTDYTLDPAYAANDFNLGRAYPANTSLFLNSIYWLANLDQLIGSNPRSTAVHRIDQIDEAQRSQLRTILTITLPLLALIAGSLVYLKRHKH